MHWIFSFQFNVLLGISLKSYMKWFNVTLNLYDLQHHFDPQLRREIEKRTMCCRCCKVRLGCSFYVPVFINLYLMLRRKHYSTHIWHKHRIQASMEVLAFPDTRFSGKLTYVVSCYVVLPSVVREVEESVRDHLSKAEEKPSKKHKQQKKEKSAFPFSLLSFQNNSQLVLIKIQNLLAYSYYCVVDKVE